jgi:hypothetical protein
LFAQVEAMAAERPETKAWSDLLAAQALFGLEQCYARVGVDRRFEADAGALVSTRKTTLLKEPST